MDEAIPVRWEYVGDRHIVKHSRGCPSLTWAHLSCIVREHMEETGRVVTACGDRAEVEVTPGGACDRCGASGFCTWTGRKAKLVTALNRAGAAAGDSVTVRTADRGRSLSALLVFGLPGLLMAGGVVLGSLLWSDTWGAVLAGMGLLAALVVLKIVDAGASRSGRMLPVVVRKRDSEANKGVSDANNCSGDTGRGVDDDVR